MTSSTDIVKYNINDHTIYVHTYTGSYGKYYNINGVNYDIHFPIEWIFQYPFNKNNMDPLSFGPEECNLCVENGYYGGVFIGYCVHCAKYANFERGYGMISHGVEIDQVKADELGVSLEYKKENSMWNVYMQSIDLSKIGDESLLKNYFSFFKPNYIHPEKVFDLYGWLNNMNPIEYYISDDQDTNLDLIESEYKKNNVYKKLSLILPEPESDTLFN